MRVLRNGKFEVHRAQNATEPCLGRFKSNSPPSISPAPIPGIERRNAKTLQLIANLTAAPPSKSNRSQSQRDLLKDSSYRSRQDAAAKSLRERDQATAARRALEAEHRASAASRQAAEDNRRSAIGKPTSRRLGSIWQGTVVVSGGSPGLGKKR